MIELSELWQCKISAWTICNWINKCGYTYKKTFYHPKRDKKLVKKFIDTIKTIDQSKIIYIDEVGSEDNMTFKFKRKKMLWNKRI